MIPQLRIDMRRVLPRPKAAPQLRLQKVEGGGVGGCPPPLLRPRHAPTLRRCPPPQLRRRREAVIMMGASGVVDLDIHSCSRSTQLHTAPWHTHTLGMR